MTKPLTKLIVNCANTTYMSPHCAIMWTHAAQTSNKGACASYGVWTSAVQTTCASQTEAKPIAEMSHASRQFFEQTYSELEEAVFTAAVGVFQQPAFSFRNFLWAAATVRSRSHVPLEGDNLALVPLADLVRAVRLEHT